MARKILLADDSVTAQNMGRRILTDAGYEVVTVNNGSAALKKIAEQAPDLIVLDVYMPGYSGLEVCQRIKENRETSRIPVLLTVGKLEPFKPEEARRVRADAYIVKPFEASELLTALTKLEDKIVPQPEPYKPGRFAKAIASVEGKGEDFGDRETGWKERLIIPPPVHKLHEELPPEAPAVATATFRELARPEDFKPAEVKTEFERPIPAGLPADITPEEIAAITAAAAAFSGKPAPAAPAPDAPVAALEEMAVTPEAISPATTQAETTVMPEAVDAAAVVADENAAEPAPATFASVAPMEASPAESAPAESVPEPAPASEETAPIPAPEVAASEPAPTEEKSAAPAETESQPNAAVEPIAEPAVAADRSTHHDAEVLAAVASLGAPTNGDGRDSAGPDGDLTNETPARVAAAVAELAAVGTFASGPRWIAEPIPLAEEESTLILEREMEKSYAAFAAADAARTAFAAASLEVAAAASIAELPAIAPAESAAPGTEPSRDVPADPSSEPAVAISEPVPTPEPIPAEAVATASESSPAEVSAPVASIADSAPPPAPAEAAYAAAASASSSAGESTTLEPVSPAADSDDRQREAELAAAWANWHQIRDSIMGSQIAVQIADAEAGFNVQKPEPAPPAEPEARPEVESQAAATPDEPSPDVSSIVDNMLAELKPKLMEELARKLGNEKKKKK
ncbi:MAG: response regulator [Acidobacteriia bacterium]|nr:response regulator [Terriglobia bacterium]